jgi:Polyketide cyclase / dehydrase and lipid transport
MAMAYYSIVLDYSSEAVWRTIRPFDHYAWAGVEGETIIEGGKAGDQIGAIRRVATSNGVIRQSLVAHSDLERTYSYRFVGPPPFPVVDYLAALRVRPVVADDRAFVEWSATFDCAPEERTHWVDYFERQGFAKWLSALDAHMARATKVPMSI